MADIIVLDAVGVASLARAARDAANGHASTDELAGGALAMLPDAVSAALRSLQSAGARVASIARDALTRYANELDEIAEGALSLDQREHELEHQLRWWGGRIAELESLLTGVPASDIETRRDLALFRGRVSGAQAMQRHYTQERAGLVDRHDHADAACAAALSGT